MHQWKDKECLVNKTQDPTTCYLQDEHFKYKDTDWLRVKGWRYSMLKQKNKNKQTQKHQNPRVTINLRQSWPLKMVSCITDKISRALHNDIS